MHSNETTDTLFAEVYYKYVDMVYRICFMYLKDKAAAQDGLQDIFVKYSKVNKVFESEEHQKAWFIVTSQNYCKTKLNYWWNKKRVNLDDIIEPSVTKENEHELLDVVLSLPNNLKTVVYLHYNEDYKVNEIAEVLQVNPNTIKSQLVSAHKQLKEKLGDV